VRSARLPAGAGLSAELHHAMQLIAKARHARCPTRRRSRSAAAPSP
jgi:hypothetical protein